jgi:hypothetical protein
MPRIATKSTPVEREKSSAASRKEALARFSAGKDMARGFAEGLVDEERLGGARSFCREMGSAYWAARAITAGADWGVAACAHKAKLCQREAGMVARSLGETLAMFDDVTAGYLMGTVYTAMLPTAMRSEMGAFYTPPQYVEHLLDQVERAGIDWTKARVADPACGGGAFLAPVALRMWRQSKRGSAELTLYDIAARLKGFELDPFAAWMSHVTMEAALLPLCVLAKKRLPNCIQVGDSLELDIEAEFDVIIGNPPYSKVKVTPAIKARYSRSLYGHANLYGLFTDLAVRMTKPGGVVAFVTPTSFLGGQYFKALRAVLLEHAPPRTIDFISERSGVFDDVLQETLLVVYERGATPAGVQLCGLATDDAGKVAPSIIDTVVLDSGDGPWLLPRQPEQAEFLRTLRTLPCRLGTFGYGISTGQLVWNRHKPQLSHARKSGEFPLVWAESVSSAGFAFSADKKNHAPYINVYESQPHLITREPCVLVQRTTAKEQDRRLICSVLPRDFVAKHGGVVVENHLNIVKALRPTDIKPETINAVLNSHAADRAFRCISGSVAVSAYELEALPLPSHRDLLAVQAMLESGAADKMIARRINKAFGATKV